MERPILFGAPMIRAILDGRKSQTRRIVRVPAGMDRINDRALAAVQFASATGLRWVRCPYSDAAGGGRLWCRETWALNEGCEGDPDAVGYQADGAVMYYDSARLWSEGPATWNDIRNGSERWRPSIYMPRWASRLTLDVLSVRVEPLQIITDDDIRAEGVTIAGASERTGIPVSEIPTLRDAWRLCWDSINGKRASWASNPWVWCIAFRRVEQSAKGVAA